LFLIGAGLLAFFILIAVLKVIFSLIGFIFQLLLLIVGTSVIVVFLNLFINNYSRYGDFEKALSASVEDFKKLLSDFGNFVKKKLKL